MLEEPISYSVAGGVVIDDDRALLLVDRLRGEVRLPKGRLRRGESRERAAVREVIEETGYAHPIIVAPLGSEINEFSVEGRTVRRHETWFLMRLECRKTAPRDSEDEERFEVCWSPFAGAVERLRYENEREMLRRGIAFAHTLQMGEA